jgi:hypothetical protein
VALWRRGIIGGFRGFLWHSIKFIVWSWNGKPSWKMCGVTLERRELFGNVSVLVYYLNGKWLKNLDVLEYEEGCII